MRYIWLRVAPRVTVTLGKWLPTLDASVYLSVKWGSLSEAY